MFGLGLLAILTLGVVALLWLTSRFPSMRAKAAFLLLVLGGLVFYPFAYRFSPSYANFLSLCELPDRYQVLRTKQVDYIYLNRDDGADCKAGPTVIGNLPYAGFDCTGPNSKTTTGTFRYTKKPSWREGCGLECFESDATSTPEVTYKSGHRQGHISGSVVTITYHNGRMGAKEEPDEKLRFSDTLLLDDGNEMAFTRSYIYYPYGNGWATLLGAASGSAPSILCKKRHLQWNVLDVYKPRAGA